MNSMWHLWHRFYADFLMTSRLGEYRTLIEKALGRGYEVCSIRMFWSDIKAGRLDPTRKYLVLRHDIDTDLTTTRMMWRIESDLGISSSYYFRLSTLDIALMREIERSGSEASYHYEEIASLAKEKRLRDPNVVLARIRDAQELFRNNLSVLRMRTRLPMSIVASHGDFVNRRLKISNLVLLQDPAFREEMKVELEVYDDAVMRYVTSRHSDTLYPRFWLPTPPEAALRRGEPVIYILVHPRHWRANPAENLIDDVQRCWEGLAYAL
jgi:hypothetical protein